MGEDRPLLDWDFWRLDFQIFFIVQQPLMTTWKSKFSWILGPKSLFLDTVCTYDHAPPPDTWLSHVISAFVYWDWLPSSSLFRSSTFSKKLSKIFWWIRSKANEISLPPHSWFPSVSHFISRSIISSLFEDVDSIFIALSNWVIVNVKVY